MIHITGPALAVVLVVGYLGVNAIADMIGSLFRPKKEHEDQDK